VISPNDAPMLSMLSAINWLAPANIKTENETVWKSDSPVVLEIIPNATAMGKYPSSIGNPEIIPFANCLLFLFIYNYTPASNVHQLLILVKT
jgi:hypothetical protein